MFFLAGCNLATKEDIVRIEKFQRENTDISKEEMENIKAQVLILKDQFPGLERSLEENTSHESAYDKHGKPDHKGHHPKTNHA